MTWLDLGFTARDADAWRDHRHDAWGADEWASRGFTPQQADEWAMPAPSAQEWQAAGFSVTEANEWFPIAVAHAFTTETADMFRSAGYSAPQAHTYCCVQEKVLGATSRSMPPPPPMAPIDMTPKPVRKHKGWRSPWFNLGFPYWWMARPWIRHGLTPGEAYDWQKARVKPAEGGGWKQLGLGPSQCKEWRAAGFGPVEAQAWMVRGFTDPTLLPTDGCSPDEAAQRVLGGRRVADGS